MRVQERFFSFLKVQGLSLFQLSLFIGLDHHSGRWLRCYWHEVGHLGRAGSSARGSRRQWYPGEDLFEQRFGGTSEEALGGSSTVRAAAMEMV